MAFKLVVLAAAFACANAGVAPIVTPLAYSPAAAVSSAYLNTVAAPLAPAAYAAPVAAVHAPHYGASSQSVVRSPLGGTVAHYNKAVDSAFSTVRKYDTRITNDAYAHYAAPVAAYAAAPVVAKTAIAYSPAVAVAHASFAGFGAHYEW